MKETICTIAGIFGSFIAGLFGGWDTALATLLIFMAVDYVTGNRRRASCPARSAGEDLPKSVLCCFWFWWRHSWTWFSAWIMCVQACVLRFCAMR